MIKKILLIFFLMTKFALAESYQVFVYGQDAGKVSVQTKISKDHYYIDVSSISISPLFAIFAGSQLKTSVVGKIKSSFFYPDSLTVKGIQQQELFNINFLKKETKKSNISEVFTGVKTSFAQDGLTQALQIMNDLKKNQLRKTYYLITDHRVRAYQAVQDKLAVKLSQINGSRAITLQFNQNYQLGSVSSYKRDREVFRLERLNKN